MVDIGSCESLSDQPATMSQLDNFCEPVWLTYHFPGVEEARRHVGKASA